MILDERILQLLERWEELREEGEAITPEQLCANCPELIEVVKRRVQDLEDLPSMISTLKDPQESSLPSAPAVEEHTRATSPAMELASSIIRYRPLRFHAKGGLGEVLVAHDAELGREVALKRIQDRHQGHPSSRREFLREAEITARLEHPGVVPVHGLVQDERGQPCYAMRFIQGESLDMAIKRFHEADRDGKRDPGERSLALREMLNRFAAVCNTIAYAHSRGVLHRDLKPQNVMLGKYGETLVVDWGLAKPFARSEEARATGEETVRPSPIQEETQETRTGEVKGTPAYMSPEQASGRIDEIGPASDIFALGATLYAILTGVAPYQGANSLSKASRAEFTPPAKLKPQVPRPLEAVCLKAMAVKPENRFGTAKELAEDVERWLADEPVMVYHEPLPDRVRRWGRRHRALVAGMAALVLTTTAALTVSLVVVNAEKNRTAKAEKEALAKEALANSRLGQVEKGTEILGSIFRDLNPRAEEKGGDKLQVQLGKRLAQAAAQLQGEAIGDPVVVARLQSILGACLLELGHSEEARGLLERARETLTEQLGTDHPDTLRSMNNLAHSYHALGRYADALKLHEETFALQKAKLGPDHLDTLLSMNNLAASYSTLGRGDDALKLREETLALMKAKLGPDHPHTLSSMNNLAISYANLGRRADGLKLFQETLALRKAKLGSDHADTLQSMTNLATSYSSLGRHTEALKLREETLALMKAKLGPDHPDTLACMNNLAFSYNALGRYAEALKLHEETFALQKAKLGPDHPYTLASMLNLANSFDALNRQADALKLREETLALRKGKLGPDHPDTLTSMNNLAASYHALGRDPDALKLREETLALRKAKLGPDHPDTLTSMNDVAASYDDLGRHIDALKLHEKTLALRKAKLGPEHPDTLASMHNLGYTYSALGRQADALKLREETLALRKAKLGPDHPYTLLIMHDLAITYSTLGRHADALKLRKETLGLRKAKLGASHPDSLWSMWALAESLVKLDRGSEALPIIDECLKRAAGTVVPPQLIPAVVDIRLRHFEKAKEPAGCRQTAEMCENLKRTDADSLYNAACFRAVTAAVIRATDKSEAAAKNTAAEADLALAWLKQAVAAGYKDVAHMKEDNDLDVLRDRPDFQQLLAELQPKK